MHEGVNKAADSSPTSRVSIALKIEGMFAHNGRLYMTNAAVEDC